ncbi:hypothetical protein [Nonomuraea aurantiaca]|uniref:hypothetical protein n=1 Tax=Nonomuraea aurantiaca TaxID=2878562 RepID=UPI001CD99BFB|nr:hypothetical protein [Nonomuraea aurantiaca]MCA2229618.1 hypothetical protein [Nonomuraea aurantiaca]
MTLRRPLTPSTAQITTAAVEIKTLTVNGKQVTLAVFRQLYEEPLYDRFTWQPAGMPWCRVNYHPDKCADGREHEHVVWQQDDQLRRARIDRPQGLWSAPILGYDDDAALCLITGNVSGVQIDHENIESLGRPINAERSLHISLDSGTGTMTGKLCIDDNNLARMICHREHHGGRQLLLDMHADRHPSEPDCAQARQAVNQRLRQYTDWLAKAAARWNEVRSLDQVFIAV